MKRPSVQSADSGIARLSDFAKKRAARRPKDEEVRTWQERAAAFARAPLLILTTEDTEPHIVAFHRASLHVGSGKFEQAVEEFLQAIKLRPDFEIAWTNLGILIATLREFPEAAPVWQKAVRQYDLVYQQYAQYRGEAGGTTPDQIPSSEAAARQQLRMDDAANDLNAAADEQGVSRKDVLELIKRKAAEAGRETAGRAKAEPRADWIEAHKQGIAVPEFIEKTFATELADGTMHKGMFDRYRNLRRDFHAHKRHHTLPEWLAAVPTQAEWNRQHPNRPEPLPVEEVRRAEREARRARRHQARALTP
jgi:tetratricopeptide (TPR) repeat protein